MSRDIAIEVEGLGKRFDIGDDQAGYMLLTESIAQRVKSLGRRPSRKEFWALRDINFEVERGKTLGVIGHNGAGKSTLLKILSRITPPTEGRAHLRGRVGALLEVGTGFHPELTGRENIFLNGAILNMKRREIISRFDEIVEFADIGPFIDTPVKHYSSGMQLRLAFSVAAHLEPEILIVDEVLSVGDLAFQRKCLGRMEAASREGRTVVFISHNLPSVASLCDDAILLSKGRIVGRGSPDEVVRTYVEEARTDIQQGIRDRETRHGDGSVRFTDLHFERDGKEVDSCITGEDCVIVLGYEKSDGRPLRGANFWLSVLTLDEAPLIYLSSEMAGADFQELPPRGEIRCHLPRCPLPADQYALHVGVEVSHEVADWVQHALEFTVAGGNFYGTGHEGGEKHPSVLVDQAWSAESSAGMSGHGTGAGDLPSEPERVS